MRASCHKAGAGKVPVVPKAVRAQTSEGLLDGFCPEPVQDEHVAVNANGLMLFLPLEDVEWLEARGNSVALHVGKQTHRLGCTLAAVEAKLLPGSFRRIAPSTLVNVKQVKELQPICHGKCNVLLHSGARLTFMRSYLSAWDSASDCARARVGRRDQA